MTHACKNHLILAACALRALDKAIVWERFIKNMLIYMKRKFLTVIFGMLLIGCSSTEQVIKEPTALDLKITASENVNLDEKGKTNPIEVRIYELKESTVFENSDFFSLKEKDKEILRDSLLSRKDSIFLPGEEKRFRWKSNSKITAIGIVAGYKNLPNSVWRKTYKLEPLPEASWYRFAIPSKKIKLDILLQEAAIELNERK